MLCVLCGADGFSASLRFVITLNVPSRSRHSSLHRRLPPLYTAPRPIPEAPRGRKARRRCSTQWPQNRRSVPGIPPAWRVFSCLEVIPGGQSILVLWLSCQVGTTSHHLLLIKHDSRDIDISLSLQIRHGPRDSPPCLNTTRCAFLVSHRNLHRASLRAFSLRGTRASRPFPHAHLAQLRVRRPLDLDAAREALCDRDLRVCGEGGATWARGLVEELGV